MPSQAKNFLSKHFSNFLVPLICASFYLMGWFVRSSMNILASQLELLYGLDIATISFISSGFYLTYTLMQIPVGFLVDRYGIQKNILVSLIIFAGGAFIFSTTQSAAYLYLARALMGFGSSFAFVSSIKSMYLYLPKEMHRIYNSLLQVFCALGLLLAGEPLLVFITSRSIPQAFGLTVLCSCLLIIVAIFMPNKKEVTVTQVGLLEQLQTATACFRKSQILANAFFCFTICTGTALFVELWCFEYISLFYNNQIANDVYRISAIGTALCSVLWGFLLKSWKQKTLMVGSSIIALISSLFLLYVKMPKLLLLVFAFIFAGMQTSHIICFLRIGYYVPLAYVGVTLAFVNMFIPLGQALMQPISGFLLGWLKHLPRVLAFQYTLSIIPIFMLISIIISYMYLDEEDV